MEGRSECNWTEIPACVSMGVGLGRVRYRLLPIVSLLTQNRACLEYEVVSTCVRTVIF